jgi:hypothetical protein
MRCWQLELYMRARPNMQVDKMRRLCLRMLVAARGAKMVFV